MSKKNEIHIHIHQLVGEVKTCPCSNKSTDDLSKTFVESLNKIIESASLSGQDQDLEKKQ